MKAVAIAKKIIPADSNIGYDAIQEQIFRKCRRGVTLGGMGEGTIAKAPEASLVQELEERNVGPIPGGLEQKRSMLKGILQKERTYYDLKFVLNNGHKFKETDDQSIKTDVKRQISCWVHVVMRMNEKVLNLLYEKCYHDSTGKTQAEPKLQVHTRGCAFVCVCIGVCVCACVCVCVCVRVCSSRY